jgi:hypothetical protein
MDGISPAVEADRGKTSALDTVVAFVPFRLSWSVPISFSQSITSPPRWRHRQRWIARRGSALR